MTWAGLYLVDEDNDMLIYTHRVCMIILWRFYCGILFCFVLFFSRVLKGIGDGSDTKKKRRQLAFQICNYFRRVRLSC